MQEENTNCTGINDTITSELKRQTSGSSLKGSINGALTTISERVETLATNTPPSEDSGINSPQKLSPQNLIKSSENGYIINSIDCYTQDATSDLDDDTDADQCRQILHCSSDISDDGNPLNNGADIPRHQETNHTSIDRKSWERSANLSRNNLGTQPGEATNPTLLIPEPTESLRSSLKKTKEKSDACAPRDVISRVRFSLHNKPTNRKPHRSISLQIEFLKISGAEILGDKMSSEKELEDTVESVKDLHLADKQAKESAIHCHTLKNSPQVKLNTDMPSGLDNKCFQLEETPKSNPCIDLQLQCSISNTSSDLSSEQSLHQYTHYDKDTETCIRISKDEVRLSHSLTDSDVIEIPDYSDSNSAVGSIGNCGCGVQCTSINSSQITCTKL